MRKEVFNNIKWYKEGVDFTAYLDRQMCEHLVFYKPIEKYGFKKGDTIYADLCIDPSRHTYTKMIVGRIYQRKIVCIFKSYIEVH